MPFDFDFIGVQNYTREIVKHSWYVPYLQGKIVEARKRGDIPLTTMGWEIYPKSIYKMLKKYGEYEGVKELVITENGVAFEDQVVEKKIKDAYRVNYLQSLFYEVLRAKKEGVNVKGYFIWLMDNFERTERYAQRFGLVYVDFETQQRIIKDSGYWYSRFLKSSKVHRLF